MGAAKTKKLIEAVRKRAFEQHKGIYRPRVEGDRKTNWPACLTCHGDVDAVEVMDFGPKGVDIRAKCHGEECVIHMDFPYNIMRRDDEETWHHVQTAINNAVFFNPSIVL